MQSTSLSPLSTALDAYKAKLPGQFKPDQRFYGLVGINPKRFAQLLRGEAEMYTKEAKKLAEVLNIPVTDLI